MMIFLSFSEIWEFIIFFSSAWFDLGDTALEIFDDR